MTERCVVCDVQSLSSPCLNVLKKADGIHIEDVEARPLQLRSLWMIPPAAASPVDDPSCSCKPYG